MCIIYIIAVRRYNLYRPMIFPPWKADTKNPREIFLKKALDNAWLKACQPTPHLKLWVKPCKTSLNILKLCTHVHVGIRNPNDYTKEGSAIQPGSCLQMYGRFKIPMKPMNPGELHEPTYNAKRQKSSPVRRNNILGSLSYLKVGSYSTLHPLGHLRGAP